MNKQKEYSEKLLKHFINPHNVGKIAQADGYARVQNPVNGYTTDLYLSIQDGKISAYTWTITDESLEKLMAAMPPEEALPETGGPGLAGMLSLWLGAGGLLMATLGLGLRRLWTASR